MVMAPVCQSAPCSGEVWRWCVRRRSVPTCGCQRSGELSFQHHGNRTSAIKTRRVLLRHSHVSSHYRGCLLLLPAPPTGQDETLILTVSCVRKNIFILSGVFMVRTNIAGILLLLPATYFGHVHFLNFLGQHLRMGEPIHKNVEFVESAFCIFNVNYW